MTTTDHRGSTYAPLAPLPDGPWHDQPHPPPPAPANVREAAINSALYALGDSALTHDGWLRPRVWELADQIAAYIATGRWPGSVQVCTCPPGWHSRCPEHGTQAVAP